LDNNPINGKEASEMRCFSKGRVRKQFRFLRRQFLQDGKLPFSDVLTAETIAPALQAIEGCWKDRIYSPLVTLWVFLGQVLSGDPSCRAAVGHSVGGITYRHYAHRAPLAFKAIMTLPQPTAFSALVRGYDGECPCCRRPFADAS
jgi:hypothetical protein